MKNDARHRRSSIFSTPHMNPAALITGGSRGIGRGIALALTKAGWDVLINYRGNEEAARATARDCQSQHRDRQAPAWRAEICQGDISIAADRERLLQTMRDKFGRLDLLVNNAGVAPTERVDILDAKEESFDRLISINTKGPYFLTQAAAHWMIDQAKSNISSPRGQIVTISSISAYTASVSRGDYCVSKAGLSMMTKLFAARLAEFGINVFEIRPGLIATDMTAGVKEKYDALIAKGLSPIARWGEPEDIGKAVVAIAARSFPFSTGEVFNVDGGFHLRIL
jgi:NAD(P)-dependent dehydrogenase (short-subunit alcohol dehydrogenase family)